MMSSSSLDATHRLSLTILAASLRPVQDGKAGKLSHWRRRGVGFFVCAA